MTTTIAPMCFSCIHAYATVEACEAYPEGIPDDIIGWEVDHRVPNGDEAAPFVFEQDPTEEPFDQDVANAVFGRS